MLSALPLSLVSLIACHFVTAASPGLLLLELDKRQGFSLPVSSQPPLATPAPSPNGSTQATTTTAQPTTGESEQSSDSVSIPSTAIAGGISYTVPAPTQTAHYYKVAPNAEITFGWNFTSLLTSTEESVTPASLTFEARCADNGYTYPVGPTSGVPADQMSIVWNPYEDQRQEGAIPFAEATYTLRVFDERGKSAAPTAGHFFGDNTILRFGLYRPAAYTPLSAGWKCIACSDALGSLATLDMKALFVVPTVTAACLLIGSAAALYQ